MPFTGRLLTNLQSVILFHVCGVYGDLDLAPNKILNEQTERASVPMDLHLKGSEGHSGEVNYHLPIEYNR